MNAVRLKYVRKINNSPSTSKATSKFVPVLERPSSPPVTSDAFPSQLLRAAPRQPTPFGRVLRRRLRIPPYHQLRGSAAVPVRSVSRPRSTLLSRRSQARSRPGSTSVAVLPSALKEITINDFVKMFALDKTRLRLLAALCLSGSCLVLSTK